MDGSSQGLNLHYFSSEISGLSASSEVGVCLLYYHDNLYDQILGLSSSMIKTRDPIKMESKVLLLLEVLLIMSSHHT